MPFKHMIDRKNINTLYKIKNVINVYKTAEM